MAPWFLDGSTKGGRSIVWLARQFWRISLGVACVATIHGALRLLRAIW